MSANSFSVKFSSQYSCEKDREGIKKIPVMTGRIYRIFGCIGIRFVIFPVDNESCKYDVRHNFGYKTAAKKLNIISLSAVLIQLKFIPACRNMDMLNTS